MDVNCIFCKIINKQIPSKVVYEDELVLGFHDINPLAQVHYVFVPKKHADSLAHLKDFSIMSKICEAAVLVAEKEGFKEKGFRTIINTGQGGGQTVGHLHMHLLAGSKLKAHIN